MDVIALDIECTISNKGNPFDATNKFVLGAIGTDTNYTSFTSVSTITKELDSAKLVCLFNGKFDLHWLRNIGYRINPRMSIWDCQLAEFILSNQKNKYPSLEETSIKYNLGHKIDVIKLKYWDNGIDTDKIPSDVLSEYLQQDISLTYKIYLKQVEEFKKPEHISKYKVFRMQCADLLVLEEMEYNGYKFDVDNAIEKTKNLETRITEIEDEILSYFPNIPLNLGSNDHISCMLYGGTITSEYRVPVGVYKTGAKQGETRYRVMQQVFELPRRVEPLRGSELAKEGYWQTDEPTLLNLKAKKETNKIIQLLLEKRGLDKMNGTYFAGIPSLIEKMNWQDNLIHGNLNQCVAGTSRLSATKPNQQNMGKEVKALCISRY